MPTSRRPGEHSGLRKTRSAGIRVSGSRCPDGSQWYDGYRNMQKMHVIHIDRKSHGGRPRGNCPSSPANRPAPGKPGMAGEVHRRMEQYSRGSHLFRGRDRLQLYVVPGLFDIRVPETGKAQAEQARQYGIGGFCYYECRFTGTRLAETPVNDVPASGEPDVPFCICRPSQRLTGIWHGAPSRIRIERIQGVAEQLTSHALHHGR